MGFDPRQSGFRARVYTCWHSSLTFDYSSTIGFLLPGQQWPLCCYIHWKSGDLISLDGAPDNTDLFIHFRKPHFFFVFGVPPSPCFPLTSLVTYLPVTSAGFFSLRPNLVFWAASGFHSLTHCYPTHLPRSAVTNYIPKTARSGFWSLGQRFIYLPDISKQTFP